MRFRGPSEKAVQQRVKAVLAVHQFWISDLSQPRSTMQTPGLPDLYAQHMTLPIRLWVEVKGPKGKTSPAQEDWHLRERNAGGRVAVVRSGSEMHDYLVDLLEQGGETCRTGS